MTARQLKRVRGRVGVGVCVCVCTRVFRLKCSHVPAEVWGPTAPRLLAAAPRWKLRLCPA